MKPSQVASKLRQIASTIDNSKNPRKDLVAADLKKVIGNLRTSAVPGAMINVAIYDGKVDGWSDLLEADPNDIIGSLQERYDVPLGQILYETDRPEVVPDPADCPLDAPSRLLVIKEMDGYVMVAVAVE
jgi:hypothetical protein